MPDYRPFKTTLVTADVSETVSCSQLVCLHVNNIAIRCKTTLVVCYSFIVARISIIVHSKRLPWFRFFFPSPTFPIGIDVDAKTRTRVWKSSSRRIVPPLMLISFDSYLTYKYKFYKG